MRAICWVILFLLSNISMYSQAEYEVKILPNINTKADEIACSVVDGELIYMSGTDPDLLNDYRWNMKPIFQLIKARRGATFAEWYESQNMFNHRQMGDEGPATYNPIDSVLYFSTPDNYDGAKGDYLKIYWVKKTETGWTDPRLLSLCEGEFDYAHPWYDASEKLLVFSSNRSGGFGKMDIWYANKLADGWTEPVNLGEGVNSFSNEIFPTVFIGDIYYSSNAKGGLGGYDIHKALRTQQWKSAVQLSAPINSESDDVSLFFINDEKAFLTSNRAGGVGGDDIYVVEKKIAQDEKVTYHAVLEVDGKVMEGATIKAFNEYKELSMVETTDSTGKISLEKLRLNHNYRLQLEGVDQALLSKSVLTVYDQKGNKIRTLNFNVNGFVDMELLPLSYTELNLIPLEDESLLTINIEAQLFDKKPGDVGRNEPVTILDENGIPVAIAYTNDIGKFRFTKVEPRVDYTFRLSKQTAATHVLITDKGDRITLPVLNAEVHYTRVNPEDAIELVNEYNEKIVVSPKDIFVINRIYYDYNSANLTKEATRQLDQLRLIMERNADVGLELRSHTDSRGNDDYNLKLSDKRASAAVNYMVQTGIAAKRFSAKGFGETMLLNECDDGVECSDPEHYINRRTEIKLTKGR